MHTAVCTDEWGRARGEADTPPAEHEHDQMSVPTIGPFRRDAGPAVEDTVSPPREHRSTDVSITKVSVPLPMQAAIIAVALVIASQLWSLGGKVDTLHSLFEARDRYEQRYQSLLEEKVRLQIENAGLRTTAMDLTTAIANLRMQREK